MSSIEADLKEFQLATLLAEKGDFLASVDILEPLSKRLIKSKNFNQYLKCENQLLRLYGELEFHHKVDESKERLQDLIIQEGLELNSRINYTLGVCASYKRQLDVSKEYFEKALQLGLKEDHKLDICYAINGLAINYWLRGHYEEALKEIYNLQVFFQIMPMPELKLSSLILNGNILKNLKRYDQAMDVFWQAYDSLKDTKNFFMYILVLHAMGSTLLEQGELSMGKMYLNLAKRSMDPKNQRRLWRKIHQVLKEYGEVEESEFDLVLDSHSNLLTEKQKGRVDFKSQFILMDLLRLFMNHPGEVYSKEDLVENVWRQDYDPAVHDNKVYVTIKRLRKLIEPDYDKPKYIFRSKNGYYLNKSARVIINQ